MRQADVARRSLPVLAVLLLAACLSAQPVETLRVPAGGRLPHAAVGADGTVHLVYVVGNGPLGDLMYVTRAPGQREWSRPERVNSMPRTVTGIGPVDGAQLALGPDGRLHVAWMRIAPPTFFYTRSNEAGSGFEEQFGVASGDGIEVGPAIVVDIANNVYLFWHAGGGEDATRAVYLAVSRDGGAVFELVRPVNAEVEGACACCGVAAAIDDDGAIYLSYRGARENINRGQRLLTSHDKGVSFADELIQPWRVGACPVATTSLSTGQSGLTVAWETEGQIQIARAGALDAPQSPPGKAALRRKNPSVAVNDRGETLLAWGDGSGFRSGGTLHWQIFDAAGRPTITRDADGETIPENSVPVALARPDGRFVVIY